MHEPGIDSTRRELPCNVELEQSLLGSLLINNDVHDVVAPIVTAADFSEEVHRRIFEIAAALIGSGQAATAHTLQTYLGNPEMAPGLSLGTYVARLCSDAAPPLLARDYARGIRELAERRQVIEVAAGMIAQAHDLPPSVKPARIVTDAIAQLEPVTAAAMQDTRAEPGKEAGLLIDEIRQLHAGARQPQIMSTGFADVDKATNGYVPETLWVVGARPGVGKTTYFVASGNRAARRGAGVLGFALEVGRRQIVSRILADLSFSTAGPIEFKSIMVGGVSPEQVPRLEAARDRLGDMPFVVDTASRLSPPELRIRIRTEKARMAARGIKLGVVFIDYLKQVQASDRYKGNRTYEVGEISYSLKQIAKDEGVCIVLLAQLNRQLEARDSKRPILSDLRESGDLEADADVVAFLHREAVFIEHSRDFLAGKLEAVEAHIDARHKAELILGKNRSGPTGTFNLWCDMGSSTMSDPARFP